jgi:hypothetical protein
MGALHDNLWIFNFLLLLIVLILVWPPLVGASEIPVPEMDHSGNSFHEEPEKITKNITNQ